MLLIARSDRTGTRDSGASSRAFAQRVLAHTNNGLFASSVAFLFGSTLRVSLPIDARRPPSTNLSASFRRQSAIQNP